MTSQAQDAGARHIRAVLVNFNSAPDTVVCIRRLAAAGLPESHAIVVDNASTDGSAEGIPRLLPAARTLALPHNRGFADGANRGVAAALAEGAEAVLLINGDTWFETDFLHRLIPSSALGQVCLAPEIFRLPPLARTAREPGAEAWFAGAWRGRLPGRLRLRRPGDARVDVDYLWACCMLIGGDAWRRVGGFDPGFFLYYEDMDWCDRAQRAGIQPRIVPAARLWHAVGATLGGADAPLRRYHMTRSAVRYHMRGKDAHYHMTGSAVRCQRQGRALWVLRGIADTRIALRLGLRGDRAGLAAHVLGWRDGRRLASAAAGDR